MLSGWFLTHVPQIISPIVVLDHLTDSVDDHHADRQCS